jgi:hypothetical protein
MQIEAIFRAKPGRGFKLSLFLARVLAGRGPLFVSVVFGVEMA